MCGIAGSIGTCDQVFANAMTAALSHRGPDSSAIWTDENAAWAHTRLAIIGLGAEGEQPFKSSDGRITVIYNGEIYNHLELRSRYSISAGPTDGAILPDLWARMGSDCLRELRGMYSMAVHDSRTGHSWLSVDPMGMKTLYWTSVAGAAYFASEVTPLAQYLRLEVAEAKATQEFRDWGCLASSSSGFRGTRRLPPGSIVEFQPSGRPSSASLVDVAKWRRPNQSWADVVDVFRTSVDQHLQSDVPAALLLSSGVDSTAIAWAAAESGHRLHCVTLDFDGGWKEAETAALVAKRFGHDHVVVDNLAVLDEGVAGFLAAVDRPSIDGLNTYLACQALRERGYKVALSGAGGDELLLGYPHHHRRGLGPLSEGLARALARRSVKRAGPDRQVPASLDRITKLLLAVARGSLSRRPAERVRAARSHRPLALGQALGSDQPLAGLLVHELSAADEFALSDWANYLAPMLLADSDVYSMATGVEMRVPFVDIQLWASVFGIRDRRAGKADFVDATRDHIVQEVFRRPKSGFDVPFWRAEGIDSPRRDTENGYWIDRRHARLGSWRELVWDAWREANE